MHEGSNAFLLTGRDGQTGKYFAWGFDVQTRCSKVHVSWRRAQNFIVGLTLLSQSVLYSIFFSFGCQHAGPYGFLRPRLRYH